jgi:hypothetical protein
MVSAPVFSVSTQVVESTGRVVDQLRSRLAGRLITTEHSSYDDARKTISILSDRRPLAIVKAADAQDVAETVKFAR